MEKEYKEFDLVNESDFCDEEVDSSEYKDAWGNWDNDETTW